MEITLKEIPFVSEGSMCLGECIEKPTALSTFRAIPLGDVWCNRENVRALELFTLEMMMERQMLKQAVLSYDI